MRAHHVRHGWRSARRLIGWLSTSSEGSTIREVSDEIMERAAIIALLRRAETGWPRIACDVLERGSAMAVLDEQVTERDTLFSANGSVQQLLSEAAGLLRDWETAGFHVHTIVDDSYPSQLREIRELPPVVFTRGRMADDTRAIAVVGTRKASERGLSTATTVADILARRGITVVSGLAAGVDTAAHRAALAAGGRTVAVIGTGIRRYYPVANRGLQERIATAGLVVSQFWPDAPPRKQQFPMRNAVMSGYAAATVVVEAGERSGARSQARLALQHGRPVVLLRDVLANEWARAFAERPGVTVVAQPDELSAVVDHILQQRAAELAPWEGVADLAIA
jgi:DNA processing protein